VIFRTLKIQNCKQHKNNIDKVKLTVSQLSWLYPNVIHDPDLCHVVLIPWNNSPLPRTLYPMFDVKFPSPSNSSWATRDPQTYFRHVVQI